MKIRAWFWAKEELIERNFGNSLKRARRWLCQMLGLFPESEEYGIADEDTDMAIHLSTGVQIRCGCDQLGRLVDEFGNVISGQITTTKLL